MIQYICLLIDGYTQFYRKDVSPHFGGIPIYTSAKLCIERLHEVEVLFHIL